MRAAMRRDNADAELARHGDSLAMALVATTKPKASWPSSEPTIGVTRSTFKFGRGLINPSRTRLR